MTFEEIERRLDGTNDDLWECLYLRLRELTELLAHVKGRKLQPFVYPMVCFASHSGARRSEIVRVKIADVDFESGIVTLHERKRDHTRTTTRRVNLSPFLVQVLKDWLAIHPGGPFLFCHGQNVVRSKKKNRPRMPLTRDEFHDHFRRAVKGSKWEVMKGAHTLRHSFISALASKGVDQRIIIDDFVGHQTDEQRQRYRHLYPSVKQEALASVFG